MSMSRTLNNRQRSRLEAALERLHKAHLAAIVTVANNLHIVVYASEKIDINQLVDSEGVNQ